MHSPDGRAAFIGAAASSKRRWQPTEDSDLRLNELRKRDARIRYRRNLVEDEAAYAPTG